MANKITIEKMIGGVINITSYGYPSKETTSWLDGEGLPEIPVYDGFDDYLWVVDESRSTSMYLDEFKRLLQEQNPQPKYNVKSLQNDKVTWGYVSLWNHFSTNPSYKDGFENIVQELPQNMTTIRFPFQVYKNNNLIRGAVMYAEVKRVTGEATLTWINGSNHLTTTVKLIGETGALVGELPDSSIITGYDFNGWFTQQNGQGLQVTPETKVYGDSTFYANYTPIEYTITYNTNGHGELPSNLPTKYTIESETITPSQLLSNDDNWIFKGWQPQSIPHGSTGNKTFNAQWEEVSEPSTQSYNVRFLDSDNVTILKELTVQEGGELTQSQFPTIINSNGYLIEWMFGTQKVEPDMQVTQDMDIVLMKTPIVYTISFNMNGHGVQIANTTYTVEDEYTPPTPENVDGWNFTGWEPQSISIGTTENITFNAQWEELAEWGRGTWTITDVQSGRQIVMSANNFDTNTGYSTGSYHYRCGVFDIYGIGYDDYQAYTIHGMEAFGYYYIGKTAVVEKYGDENYLDHKDEFTFDTLKKSQELNILCQTGIEPDNFELRKFRLEWSEDEVESEPYNYRPKITWDFGTGKKSTSEFGYSITLSFLDEKAREGYNFNGWYTQPNGQGERVSSDTVIYDSATFYAKYIPIQYSITYDLSNHGTNPNTKTTYTIEDDDFTPLPMNDVNGWKFANWDPMTIPSGSTGNVTFTAQWDEDQQENPDTPEQPETKDTNIYFTTENGKHPHVARNKKSIEDYTMTCEQCPSNSRIYQSKDILTIYGGDDCEIGLIDANMFDAVENECEMKLESVVFTSVGEQFSIGDYAFRDCKTLSTFQIPDNCNCFIGTGAFQSCTLLEELSIPSNTYSIGDDAFYGCDYLITLSLPCWTVETAKLNALRIGIPDETTVKCSDGEFVMGEQPLVFNVTWNNNGSTNVTQVNYGSTPTMPSTPTRKGYEFDGWYTQTNGNGSKVDSNTKITENTTFYANWNVIHYTITYNTNEHGTSNPNTKTTYTIEDDTFTPSPMQNDGSWIFDGWTPESIVKGTTENITFTAQWHEEQQEEPSYDQEWEFEPDGEIYNIAFQSINTLKIRNNDTEEEYAFNSSTRAQEVPSGTYTIIDCPETGIFTNPTSAFYYKNDTLYVNNHLNFIDVGDVIPTLVTNNTKYAIRCSSIDNPDKVMGYWYPNTKYYVDYGNYKIEECPTNGVYIGTSLKHINDVINITSSISITSEPEEEEIFEGKTFFTNRTSSYVTIKNIATGDQYTIANGDTENVYNGRYKVITCEENTIFIPQGDAYDTVYVSTDILTINKKVIVAQHTNSGYSIVTNTTSEEIQLKNTSKNTTYNLPGNKRVLLANGDYTITQCPENGVTVNDEQKSLNDTITISENIEIVDSEELRIKRLEERLFLASSSLKDDGFDWDGLLSDGEGIYMPKSDTIPYT